jgi:hypothetical protein
MAEAAGGDGGDGAETRGALPAGPFGRTEASAIRKGWESGEWPVCPRCSIALDPASVPPRSDVAYVRDRVVLVCRSCRRSTGVERRDLGRTPRAAPEPLPPPHLEMVGWREWVSIDGHPAGPLKAKVDTGARSSALHAENVQPISAPAGAADGRWVRFTVRPRQRSDVDAFEVEAPLVDRRVVRSSTGNEQERPVVHLSLRVGSHDLVAEVTLTRRDLMGFRMLLGRTALRGRFLVDPGASYLQGRPTPPASPGATDR